MNISEAINNRHSVRKYTNQIIPNNIIEELKSEVEVCNHKSNLNIQLITNEPEAFSGFTAHYGMFKNVKNYFAMVGKSDDNLDEKIGYYGEHLVLKAQQLGLDTCWVAATYKKKKSSYTAGDGEKLVCVITLGYGQTQGKPHKNKPIEKVCDYNENIPDWFLAGVNSAMLAPTAMNRQKFFFSLNDLEVSVKSFGGAYSKIDLGILKYHFETAANSINKNWKFI